MRELVGATIYTGLMGAGSGMAVNSLWYITGTFLGPATFATYLTASAALLLWRQVKPESPIADVVLSDKELAEIVSDLMQRDEEPRN